ncbi:hypothetical protein D9758_018394 [Tetrapyrgos nigripes]|uniref:Tc1-like transposase DDE domain-containing protein n=1 Tax=Tetrapyrgos nigripes TaxID=182062 RepID=A0A8H5BTD9_9AGAR|nr:hypothetical protein D9758_018394 [Tetrapyrgos nigripes]
MKSERGDIKFQHDGAPSHTAKTMKKWFSDHGIPLFPHPPSSPDLNPIEHVWHKLKAGVRARPHHPSSANELIEAVKEVWGEIEIEDIDKYVGRMDDVVQAVLDAKGGHEILTGYNVVGHNARSTAVKAKSKDVTTVLDVQENTVDDPEPPEASDDEQIARVDDDDSAFEEEDDGEINDEELAQERIQVIGDAAGKKKPAKATIAVIGENSFDIVAPTPKRSASGASNTLTDSATGHAVIEDVEEASLNEQCPKPKTTQERQGKSSKKSAKSAHKEEAANYAEIAATDVTHMYYPESGQRYISLLKQPQNLCLVISETTNNAIGIMIFRDACPKSEDQQAGIVNNRVSTIRGHVKEAAEKIVPARYELLKLDETQRSKLVKDLLKACYIFPLTNPTDTMTWRSNQPYRHPAVLDVLKEALWTDSPHAASLGKKFVDMFSSTVDEDDAKEVPMAMIDLVRIAIFAALREYTTGTRVKQNFDLVLMRTEYEKHIQLMEQKIIKPDQSGRSKYHNMAAELYREVTR